jgi:hypothetical protein
MLDKRFTPNELKTETVCSFGYANCSNGNMITHCHSLIITEKHKRMDESAIVQKLEKPMWMSAKATMPTTTP